MRALLGGEGGVIHLNKITLNAEGIFDLGAALEKRPCLPGPSNYVSSIANKSCIERID
jgi:hypothetical protein